MHNVLVIQATSRTVPISPLVKCSICWKKKAAKLLHQALLGILVPGHCRGSKGTADRNTSKAAATEKPAATKKALQVLVRFTYIVRIFWELNSIPLQAYNYKSVKNFVSCLYHYVVSYCGVNLQSCLICSS